MKNELSHTHFRRGRRVTVDLRTGQRFLDQFIERKGNHVLFKRYGRVAMASIRRIVGQRRVTTALRQEAGE